MAEPAATRILITGGTGFVGAWLVPALRARFGGGLDVVVGAPNGGLAPDAELVRLDLLDRDSVAAAVRQVRPTACIHLAGVTHVVGSAKAPGATWGLNLRGTMQLAETLVDETPECRLVHVSSGEVYGLTANRRERLDEDAPLAPANIYAVTKAAADLAIGEMALRGLRAVRFRPFNHTGPGQSPDFVVPGIAAQVARAEAAAAPAVIRIGATDRARDFMDVRDVCAAYVAAVERFDDLPNGVAMNLASGQARTIQSVLDDLLAQAGRPIEVKVDETRIRPNDVARICGDAGLAKRLLDWSPTTPWGDTLTAVLGHWRAKVAAGEAAP
ncbi:MAG: GDP-mannose 4,6-dehydratase [Caulobacteraceae bacterium]